MRLFKKCKHENIRCIHGDEINQTARLFRRPEIARVACLDCYKYLYNKEYPEICSETGLSHCRTRRKKYDWGTSKNKVA